jgi:Leucine-rich repeat (LRR) protein
LSETQIKHLVLANNQLKIFDLNYIPDQIKSLDLSFNKIAVLDFKAELFLYMLILSISLAHNELNVIDSDLMTILVKGDRVDLSHNKFGSLNKTSDYYRTNINYLNLSHNSLTSIGELFYIASLSQPYMFIVTFDLSSNCFESFDFSFDDMKTLMFLYLMKNKLSSLDEKVFANLKLLIELDISVNRFTYFGKKTFKSLEILEYLNISSNFIDRIDEDQFSKLVNLFSLDMSDNLIEYFYPRTFTNLLNLKNLYIDENRLKIIEKLDGLRSIRNFYLDSYLILANSTNVVNIEESINVQLHKSTASGVNYFKSVNVITRAKNITGEFLNEYCSASMFLIKNRISLNLKTDLDFIEFFAYCVQFSRENMFVESV